MTDANGRVEIVVPADTPWLTWTVAKPGLLPVTTFYRARIEEVRAQLEADGEIYALLEWKEPVVPHPAASLTASCSPGCCVGRGMVDWCLFPGGSDTGPVPRRSQPYLVTAVARDEQLCPTQRAEALLPDTLTDQQVHFDFDDADPTEPVFFDLTLLLPTDPASLFQTSGLDVPFMGWPARVEDHAVNRWRGLACNHRVDLAAGKHVLTVGYFPKPDGELDLDIREFPVYSERNNRWSAAFSGRSFPDIPAPGGVYPLLDIPRLSSPSGTPTRAARFSWQSIPGAAMYELHVQTDLAPWLWERVDRTLWLAVSWSHQDITLPEPPAGYDPIEQWGEPATGEYRVIACDRWLPWSHRRLWWEPRAAAEVGCGYGWGIDGPLH